MSDRLGAHWFQKPIQIMAFFVTSVVIVASAQAQSAPVCLDLFNLTPDSSALTPIEELYQPDSRNYLDNYSPAEHNRHFWKYHERFGLVRRGQDQLVLIAKTEALGEQLVKELAAYSGLPVEGAKRVKPPGFWPLSRTAAYDVTALLPEIMRTHIETTGKNEGPNCLNMCMVMTDHASNLIYTGGREFSHWIKSPYARPIISLQSLRPGDVLVMYASQPGGAMHLEHAAIYVSPNLVLTKNGMGPDRPVRLMDLNEMVRMYSYMISHEGMAFVPKLKAYRLLKVEDVLARNGLTPPELFLQVKAELEMFEQSLAAYHEQGQGRLDELKTRFRDLDHKWREKMRAEERAIENSPLRVDKKDLLLTLWESLQLRFRSIREGFPGPY